MRVEGGVLPVVISGAVSAMLIAIASQSGSIPLACLGSMPFVVTFGYLLIFVCYSLLEHFPKTEHNLQETIRGDHQAHLIEIESQINENT